MLSDAVSAPTWRAGWPMIEAWNTAWGLWILVKLDVAPGEVAGVLFAGQSRIRSWYGVWRSMLGIRRMNLRGHRHHQGSGQKHRKKQRGRDPAPADLFLSEVLHNTSQRQSKVPTALADPWRADHARAGGA